MPLLKVLIQNFQPHKKRKLELDSKITTITGDTDAGKSSLCRAIRWVCLNQPRGDSFIREGSPGCTVQLVFDDFAVARKLGKGVNLYTLDGEEFKTPGTSVPEPIARMLCVSDLNFQDQHDALYWISLPPPEVSRQLNAIVDLGIIDSTLSNASKNLRDCQAAAKFTADRLRKAKQDVAESDWVVDADDDLVKVEEAAERLGHVSSRYKALSDVLSQVRTLEDVVQRKATQLSEINEIGRIGKQWKDKTDRSERLAITLAGIARHRRALETEIIDVSPLDEIVAKVSQNNRRIDRLNAVLSSLETLAEAYKEKAEEAERWQRELDSLNVCPICGKDM